MLLWFLAKNIGIVFGLIYPAYQTFKALDGKNKEAKGQLLRYWAVFATFTAAEFYTDMLVSWLPFYYEIKMLILLYLSIPVTKGSSTVYEMHMKPWLRAHQAEIDEAIAQFKAATVAHLLAYRDRLASWCHYTISLFLKEKIPSLLPLYSMAIALASETFKHLFAASPKPDSPPANEDSVSVSAAPTSTQQALPSPVMDPLDSNAAATHVLPTVAQVQPSQVEVAENSEIEFRQQTIVDEIVTLPAPLLANSILAHAKTTTNVISTRSSSSSHKRDTSAPVATRATTKTQKAKKHLSGTPMPTHPLSTNNKQATQSSTSRKENVTPTNSILEEDSIGAIAISPSKRSNPRLAPIRRGVV